MPASPVSSEELPSVSLFDHLSEVVEGLPLEIVQDRDDSGRITVKAPCASPIGLRLEPLDGQVFVYFLCRTSSWHWEGERTDVHDLFSVYLAARLATAGLASCSLIDEPHPVSGIPGELYARYIVPTQPHKGWYPDTPDGREQLAALITALSEVEAELHHLGGPCIQPTESDFSVDDEVVNSWASEITEALEPDGGEPGDDPILAARSDPSWLYYRSAVGDRSVAHSLDFALTLKSFTRGETDERHGSSAQLVRRGPLRNAWADEDLTSAKNVLKDILLHDTLDILTIPLEDCLVVSSGPLTYMLRADTGKEAYERNVDLTLRQHDSFLAWARPDVEFDWTSPIDPASFEQLTYDLLAAEPNVRRVRFVGSTNDRDGGRDLLVDMVTPLTRHEIEAGGAQHGTLLAPRRILVQCKTKRDPSKSVGKADVQDIRDTIERYEADGYWLFASTRVTSQLVEHLEVLSKRQQHIDWWTRHEIEAALRRSPRIIDRHADLVTRL